MARSKKQEQARAQKVRAFCLRYLVDWNGAAAARDVGYSERNARHAAAELLACDDVKAELERLMAERELQSRVKAFVVLDNLAPIVASNIDHYVIGDDGKVSLAVGAPPDAMLAIASVKMRDTQFGRSVELKLWDKNVALGNAMKHLGMIKERHEHTGANGEPIKHEIVVRFVEPSVPHGNG